MFFEQFEIDVVERLKEKFGTTVDVEPEPEVEMDNKIPFKKARVTVMFDQSEFEKQNTTTYISQHETGRCAVLIRSRKLRGEGGIYEVAENVRRFLAGFAPGNWSKIWLLKFTFVDRKDGTWIYSLIIASKCMIVEEHEEPTGPLLINSTATYTPDTTMN